MSYKYIEYNSKDHIARITLKGIAVDANLAAEIENVCERINADSDIYVVVISGVFGQGGGEGETARRITTAVAGIECPVIAAVGGEAIGVGLEIALSADIRIVADKATFALSQVADGVIPSGGGTQRLPRIVGRGKALEMLLTAAEVTAPEALESGLVSRVVAVEKLEDETQKLAETVAAKGPIALKYLKEAVNAGMDMTLAQGLRLEADLYFLLHTTADRTEGITAFREKREPKYRGE